MKIFVAIAALVCLALLATSTRFYSFRRSRFVTLLVSGGWPAVIVGLLIGPGMGGLVDNATIRNSTPLLLLALGWVGLTIGLQARWGVIKAVPGPIRTMVGLDALLAMLVLGPGLVALLWWWTGGGALSADVITPAALLVAIALGWSMETRSLQTGQGHAAQSASVVIRVSGALASMLAVGVLGVAQLATSPPSGEAPRLAPEEGLIALFSIAGLALLLGILGRFMIARAGRSVAEQLAVFLGIVAFVGGLAGEQGDTPLLGAMLAGAVLINLVSFESIRFERFILEAEHVVAILVFVIAGMLADWRIGLHGLGLALILVAWRGGVKPWIATRSADSQPDQASPNPAVRLLQSAAMRQSPIGVALAVSVVVLDPSDFNRKLLAIVLLAGVGGEIAALLAARRGASSQSSAPAMTPTPEAQP